MTEAAAFAALRAFTMADAVLINAAAAALLAPIQEPEPLSDCVEIMARVLPRVSRDHVRMRDLAAACDAMVEHYPQRRAEGQAFSPWHRACFDAELALVEIFRRRMAEAWGQLFPDAGAD